MKGFELEPGEQVIQEVRRHWFLFALNLLPYALLFIFPVALPGLLLVSTFTASYAPFVSVSDPIMRIALGIWLLAVWTGAWSAFTRYFLNVWVLTNRRIVDVKQCSYFNREVSSLMLGRVQDVTTDVSGVMASLLGIGTITVQSAGTVDEFRMRGIPHPESMRNSIMRYVPEGPTSPPV